MKLIAAVMIGLVFPPGRVLPVAVATAPCQSVSRSCTCCEDADSCGCAENQDAPRQPAPAPMEAGSNLKVPAAKPDDARVSAEPAREVPASATAEVLPRPGSPRGYAGVRLSIAFCSFVI